MKNPFKWLRDKAYDDRKNHPVRLSLDHIFIETIVATWQALWIICNDVTQYPYTMILAFLNLLGLGGLMCHDLDKIIGHCTHDWRHADIRNTTIISLILGLEKAEKDINEGKLAWKAAFYDPSKERIEYTHIPLEPKPEEEPTVSEGNQD
jgi:hypothetical protein